MKDETRRTAGWREWVGLPALGVELIKAKLDSGARTSALHAFGIESYYRDGELRVRFTIHPNQRDDAGEVACDETVADVRTVTNPGGRRQKRFIISTMLAVGGEAWPIDLSLTERNEMGYRLLIGRTAMRHKLLLDPDHSFLLGKKKRRTKRPAKKPLKRRRPVGTGSKGGRK